MSLKEILESIFLVHFSYYQKPLTVSTHILNVLEEDPSAETQTDVDASSSVSSVDGISFTSHTE